MSQSNQLATRSTEISSQIYALEGSFTQLAQTTGVEASFKREALFAIQALQNNDYLMRTAMENPQSLRNAILNIASVGLSLNPALAEVYLVPRDSRVCNDISYRGFCTLATRSGVIKIIRADIVHESDEFELNGFGKEPTHRFKPFATDRGQIVGVYCVAKLASGEFLVDWMRLDECYAIRDKTQQWKRNQSGPWKDHEGEMLKKTVIKRAAKMWPKSSDNRVMDEAIRIANDYEGIDFEANKVEEIERKKLEAEQAREKRAEAEKEKDDMIGKITRLCGELTKGFSVAEKGRFISEVLGVKKFTDLKFKTHADLSEVVTRLEALVPIETTANTTPPEEKRTIKNYAPGAENELR